MKNKVILYDIEKIIWFILLWHLFSDGSCHWTRFLRNSFEVVWWWSMVFYIFDIENTNKLKVVLKSDDLLESLVNFFNGEMRDEKFRKLCENNEIKYDIHVM